jgi:hypothetical protein
LTGVTGLVGATGLTGPQGLTGPVGLTGATGLVGATGLRGITGLTGPQGLTGPVGLTGATGPQGSTGVTGLVGLTGATGLRGITGLTGPQGLTGGVGLTGVTGPQGSTGVTGPVGLTGATGLVGATGLTGQQGLTGGVGLTGATGLSGSTGATGPIGLTGSTGLVGATGLRGITGLTGPQGLTGPVGLTGATGLVGVTGATGIQGPAGTAGAAGAAGATGIQGPAGTAGTAGATGIQGPVGTAGAVGATGLRGVTGLTGTQGPIGITGATGIQGVAGAAGLAGATGLTGTAGLQGPAGTAGAAGVTGATGLRGATGLTGAAGTNGTNGAVGATGPVAGTNQQFIYNNNGVAAGATDVVYSSGKMGVGALTPAAKLHVNTTTASTSAAIFEGPAGGNLYVDYGGSGYNYYDAAQHTFRTPDGARDTFVVNNRTFAIGNSERYAFGARYSAGGGTVYFGATNSSNTPDAQISNAGGAALMTLQNNGNVGIGTTTPSTLLHVNGNATVSTLYGNFDSSGRSYVREWIELPNYTGILSPNNNAAIRPNDGSYGGWKFSGTRNGWAGLEFSDSNTSLMQSLDGNTTGFHRNGYGWQFYWQTGELRCFKNQYGGGTNAAVLDSSNFKSYVPTAIPLSIAEGRLTLTSGEGMPITSVSGTTLYYTPFTGNKIALYNTTTAEWVLHTFSEVSLSLASAAAATNYDVFIYDNAGTKVLELAANWSGTATRAVALVMQNGVYVKSGEANKRYIGTIRTTTAGTTVSTTTQRFIWNKDNQVPMFLDANDSTSHTFAGNSGVYAPWRNSTVLGLTRTEFVCGLSTTVNVSFHASLVQGIGGVGIDVTNATSLSSAFFNNTSPYAIRTGGSDYTGYLIGYHFLQIVRSGQTGLTSTFVNASMTSSFLG